MPQENTTINAYVLAHKATLKGIFAVDAGSTQTVGAIVAKYNLQSQVASGGFDLTPQTLSSIKSGSLGFTIDQQPYLQGFLPALYLYLWNFSGGLVNPPVTNTGLTFVTKANVGPYQTTTSRYEGSSTAGEAHPALRSDRLRAPPDGSALGLPRWRRETGPVRTGPVPVGLRGGTRERQETNVSETAERAPDDVAALPPTPGLGAVPGAP